MHHFKILRTISLILGIALVIFGCTSSKNLISVLEDIKLTAETVPEGILVTISHIPQEVEQFNIAFRDWGVDTEPNWENIDGHTSMNSLRNMFEAYNEGLVDTELEQFRQTRKVIFPFVQTGHRYIITVIFSNNEGLFGTKTIECIADKGIFFDTNISLGLNDTHTGVTLSAGPKFSEDVQFGPHNMSYSILVHGNDHNISLAALTDNLFWNFEPQLTDKLKEEGALNGNYTAFAQVTCNIIHDNISWILDIAKTPLFTYTFK